MNGTVKWFNCQKGYGFIIGEDGKDYFAHYSNIVTDNKYKRLHNEAPVTYDVATQEDGRLIAVNIKEV